MSKLDLKVNKGIGYGSDNYSVNFEVINNDTSAVNISAVRVVGYMWSQNRRFDLALESGVNSNGVIQLVSNEQPPNYPGVGQTGIVSLDTSSFVYRVNHNMIDSSRLAPLLTLNIPTNNSYIAPVSVNNRTDYYFDIVLTELPPNNAYSVTWFVPYTEQQYIGGTTALPSPDITITSATESYRVASKKTDSKYTVSWNTSEALPASCGIVSASVFIKQKDGLFFDSSIPDNSWYSIPETSTLPVDNQYFMLEEWNGVEWVVVSEYNNYGLDVDSGIGPQSSYQLKLSPVSGTSGNSSVYIAEGTTNPISSDSDDKNLLLLKSETNKTRSLIKFDISDLPTSATAIRNAVLRLNVIATTGAWSYTNTDGHVSVHRVTTNWNESEATWTNATSSTPWSAVGGDYGTETSIWLGNTNLATNITSGTTSANFWLDFDVTEMVQYWKQNPSENYGFLVRLYPNSHEATTTNIEYQINSNRMNIDSYPNTPQLLLAYNVSNTTGPTPYIEINSPENNAIVVGTSVKISATSYVSGGTIVSVSLYRKDGNGTPIFVSSLSNTSSNFWECIYTVSAGTTNDILFVKAETDLGVTSFTNNVYLSFLPTPTAGVGTSGLLCYEDKINIVGTIDVSTFPTNSYIEYSKDRLPLSASVFDVVEDTQHPGVMWFTTTNRGLWRYNQAANEWTNYNTTNSPLVSNNLMACAMKSDGNLFISYGPTTNSIGVQRFNTTNWNTYTSSDWDFYNKSNSFLSNYADISIFSIDVDSLDNVWFGLTWAEQNSVIKLTGNNFNSPFAKSYNTLRQVRSLCCKNGVFVGYVGNAISIYSSATDSFIDTSTAPYGSNARMIDTDSLGNVFVGFIGYMSQYNLATSAWSWFDYNSTPAWPNGLAGNTNHLPNGYCNSLFVDSNNDKWFGFGKGDSGEFEGGVVKYTGADFSYTNTSSTNNWTVYDKSNNISIPSNFITTGMLKDSLGNLWITTTSGVSYYNNSVWTSPNRNSLEVPIYVNQDGTWSSEFEPQYEIPLELDAKFIYSNGSITIPFTLSAGHTPTITKLYPHSDISISNFESSQKLFEYSIGQVDFVHGELCNYIILKSIDNANWVVYESGQVTKNIEIWDTIYKSQKCYYKLQATTNMGCSATSAPVMAYGNAAPVNNIVISPAPYNTTTPITLSGNFYEPDFGTILSINGYTSVDSVKSISISADTNYIGDAEFTKYQNISTSGDWKFVWANPISSATSITTEVLDYFEKSLTTTLTIPDTITSAPEITLTNPPTSGAYSIQNANFTFFSTVSSVTNISAVNFVVEKNGTRIVLDDLTNMGNDWTKVINVSAVLSSFGNIGGVYNISCSAITVDGISATSTIHSLSANNLPIFTLTNPQGPACHNGNINVAAIVSDVDGNSNCFVEILSASSIMTSATVDGEFYWFWNEPPSGIHTLSAKIYDAISSADYSLTEFVISAGQRPSLYIDNTFPSGIKNSEVVNPKINVVSAGTIELSATITSSETTYVDLWNSDKNGNKISLISAAVPNNPVQLITTYSGELKHVLVNVRTDVGCTCSELLTFYVLEPIVELQDFSNCGETIRIKGALNFDGVYGSNQYIDNNFTLKLYANSTYVDDITIIQNGAKYYFDYLWTAPTDGVDNLEFRCVNEYGDFIYNYPISPIITGTVLNQIFPTAYVNSISGLYIVSATSVEISSTLNVSDVFETQYIIETDDNISVLYSANNKISFVPTTDKIYNIKTKTITNGGCEVYSDYISVIKTTYPSNIGNIQTTNCVSDNINVPGIVAKMVFGVGEYGTSGNPGILNTEYITSAYVKDNFGTQVFSISADVVLGENASETFMLFDTSYSPALGTSSLTLYTSSSLFGEIENTKYITSIQGTTNSVITSPISSTFYPVMTEIPLSVSSTSTDISEVGYYIDGTLVKTSTVSPYDSSILINEMATKEFYAVTKTTNGCYSSSPKISASIISWPVGLVVSPANNSYIMSAVPYNINVLVSPSNIGQISAVEIYDDALLIGSASEITYNVWGLTTSTSVTNIKARVYDTAGLSAESPTNAVIMIGDTESTIAVQTSSYSTSSNIIISAGGTTPNAATIEIVEIYEIYNGQPIFIGTTTSGILEIPASLLPVGSHTIVSKATDSLGAYSYSSPIILVVASVDVVSYPTIVYLGSDPQSLMNEFGNITTSNFRVSDNTYRILSETIGVVGGWIDSITSINSNKIYDVTVNISATGSLTISATNQLSNSATYTVSNYSFACDGRKINLTNYVPNHLAFDNSGNDSEYITLTSFFEGYLNTLYINLDEPCSLGVLEKTNRLRNLHDPDTMELDYIQFFANYLGYNVDVNRSELGGFVTNPNSSAYNDGPDNSEVFNEYQKKALRFVIRNLPNWYSIKTTRNAIKTLLLSFGIFGDLLEVYTNDYVSDWVINNIPPGTYVADSMTNDRYPTPHMYVSIDINNTSLENIMGNEQMLSSVYKSFETIRPANVVFEGLVGQFSVTAPTIYADARCQLEGNMRIQNTIS